MQVVRLFGVVAVVLLSACGSGENTATDPLVGNDRDAHGCIASAGYQWCRKTQTCERSWELAQSRGFDNTPAAFQAFCQ